MSHGIGRSRQELTALGDQKIAQRARGRHQPLGRRPHHEPLPHFRQTDDIEHREPAIRELRGDRVRGNECDAEPGDHRLLDRLVRADLHADARRDAVLGQKALGQQRVPEPGSRISIFSPAMSRGGMARRLTNG